MRERKKSPLHVSDATAVLIAAGCYGCGCGGTIPVDYVHLYIVFFGAGSISINKNRIASNYSAISWTNVSSPTRISLRGGAIGSALAADRSQQHQSSTHECWPRGPLAINLCKFYAHGIGRGSLVDSSGGTHVLTTYLGRSSHVRGRPGAACGQPRGTAAGDDGRNY
jgi:hypothetical protein